jgi:hypothetical protein
MGHSHFKPSKHKPSKGLASRPKPRIPIVATKEPRAEDYLCHDFSGHSKMAEVADAICEKHYITLDALRGYGRTRELVVARREFSFICYYKLGKSTSQIGKYINKDHTTIVHHLQVATGRRDVKYYKVGQDAALHC